MVDVQTIPVLTLPSVPFAERRRLPGCPAIYFVLNGQDTVLYIGRSVNLAARWAKHHRAAMLTQHQATRIAWLVMDDAALITSVEEACIAYFEPVCNTAADARGRPAKRPNVWLGVDVGRRVRRIRRAKDVTQVQFAAQTGLNRMTISRLENGTAKEAYADTIVALARALGVSADYLLGLSEREERCG